MSLFFAGASHSRHDREHAGRDVDIDGLQVVRGRPSHPMAPVPERTASFNCALSSRCSPVFVPLAFSPSTVPSKQISPPAFPAPGPRSTTWSPITMVSGLCSTTSTVLPLSRNLEQEPVHALDVVRVQADRRLVEDVGDVGERRAEVPEHLDALRASPPDSVEGRSRLR